MYYMRIAFQQMLLTPEVVNQVMYFATVRLNSRFLMYPEYSYVFIVLEVHHSI